MLAIVRLRYDILFTIDLQRDAIFAGTFIPATYNPINQPVLSGPTSSRFFGDYVASSRADAEFLYRIPRG